jgi:hypothetical protein
MEQHRRHASLSAIALCLLFVGICALLPSFQLESCAQTNISGEIIGTVKDQSGAGVPSATISVLSVVTGQSTSLTSGSDGYYRIPFLPPGTYTVSVAAAGFKTSLFTIKVFAGTTNSGDVALNVGQITTRIDVTDTLPLLNSEDAQLSTTFDQNPVQALPNPGNDLTFFAQLTPGAVMNTQGGSGNFSVFGLPAKSNSFMLNGGALNDPYNNLNHSGASNLLLGSNEISYVTVIPNAYDSSFGGLSAAQLNEISRSGANKFRGNVNYWWNGSFLNANDWFNDNTGTPKQFDNANQWAASMGGPIVKNKIFFFVDYEGLSFVLPVRGTVYAPSPAYQSAILSSAAVKNTMVPDGNLTYNGNSAEVAQYQAIFNVFNTAPGAESATITAANADIESFNSTAEALTHEYVVSGRLDEVLGQNDKIFAHYRFDDGVQASSTNLLSPIFSSLSPQPQDYWQLNETRSFSRNIVNQFLYSGSWTSSLFTNSNQAAANSIAPFVLTWVNSGQMDNDGAAEEIGGADYSRPQGRVVTGSVFNDDVSWGLHNHTIRLGWVMNRNDVSDHSPVENTITPENYTALPEFAAGYSTRFRQTFSNREEQPIASYAMGVYVQDNWKVGGNLTLTSGLRLEFNSDPICSTNCYSNFVSNFLIMASATSANTSYNQMIQAGLHRSIPSYQKIAYEPRVGFAWSPLGANSRTAVRGGFGIFADLFEMELSNEELVDPPNSIAYYVEANYLLQSSLPGSAAQAVTESNATFQTDYRSGGSYTSMKAAVPGFVVPTFHSIDRNMRYPSYLEYSLTVEHQFPRTIVLSVSYVGNHGYHELVSNDNINAYSPTFAGLPTVPPSPGFSTVTEYSSTARSNYNGLVASIFQKLNWLLLQANYTYGHALDDVSNAGFASFGVNVVQINNPSSLSQNYGNADYDTRQNVNGLYVITIPHIYGPGLFVDGWQLSGTVFHTTGFPFSVVDGDTPTNYGAATLFADQLVYYGLNHHCGGSSHAGQFATPCAFGTVGSSSAGFAYFGKATGFNVQNRNQFYGSAYTDADLSLLKEVKTPRCKNCKLQLGIQSFNLFNHPNFSEPVKDVEDGIGAGGLGTITSGARTPTSSLGSGLGGETTSRHFQLKATLNF